MAVASFQRAGAGLTAPPPLAKLYRTAAAALTQPVIRRKRRSGFNTFGMAAQQLAKREGAKKPAALSLAQLRYWHWRRGTLHLFFALYPEEALRR
jgi:hypothetical protein